MTARESHLQSLVLTLAGKLADIAEKLKRTLDREPEMPNGEALERVRQFADGFFMPADSLRSDLRELLPDLEQAAMIVGKWDRVTAIVLGLPDTVTTIQGDLK